MRSGVQLPFQFDRARLAGDLARVPSEDWVPHYNTNDFGGDWSGAALRSRSGQRRDLNALSFDGAPFRGTSLLDLCPYFREVLDAFSCRQHAARLLSLAPGSFIREHSDHTLDFEDGRVRIHVPIQTNDAVEFYVSGERLLMEEGGAYYINVNLPHRVNNRGASARIHLVIDAEVNDWVREVFARSAPIRRIAPPPGGVDDFRAVALADPGTREILGRIDNPRAFSDEAVRLGREAGFEFHEGDVHAVLSGVPRPGPPGGLPAHFSVRDGRAFATWIDCREEVLGHLFFADAVQAALRHPYMKFSRRQAPLAAAGGSDPAGFLFHMSRCGSTLAAQSLKAAAFRVISQAPPVDDAIRTGNVEWVRAIVQAFDPGGPYVLKLDAWHIHDLALLREAFPSAPWLFLYRDPAEVLVSHARSPGRETLPGAVEPRVLRMAPDFSLRREQWGARVLAGICRAALQHRDGLFVDYRRLPDAVWTAIAPHFGLPLSAGQIAAMRAAAGFDARSPGAPFVPDSAATQEEASALAGLIAATELDRLYAELCARVGPPAARSAPSATAEDR
jgi:hypothetical protein